MVQSKTEFKYRIVYESLSHFSSNLSKCSSFESVARCLKIDAKYIIEFALLRLSFFQPGLTVSYTLCNNDCRLEKYDGSNLWESEVLQNNIKIPAVSEADSSFKNYLEQKGYCLREEPEFVWNWNYSFEQSSGLIVTLVTSSKKTFGKSDVPVLKLFAENLYSKLFSLKLIHDLDVNRNELQHTLFQLKEMHETLKDVVNRQDVLIEERTAELKERNIKLLELSKLNTHNVREPLCRIMGVINTINMDGCEVDEVKNVWLPMIYKSSEDLDCALTQTIDFVDTQIKQAKVYD